MNANASPKTVRGADESLEHLAHRAAGGDPAAFERLVRRCYDRIYRWAFSGTGDADDADDVAQETLLRMHRGLPGFRGECRFESWLYRLTSSAATDLKRARAGKIRSLLRVLRFRAGEHQAPPPVPETIDAQRKLERVRDVWKTLPPGQRQVFDLADLQGYSPNEISEMLQMNPSTVRAHLFKARRTVRAKMLNARTRPAQEGNDDV